MDISAITRAVREGEDAAADAAALRGRLRYTVAKGDAGRERDIAAALDRLRVAMEPIRSLRGRVLWEPMPSEQERALRAVSEALQYERKQLKKMRA